mgnify:CR=1 FL=1
MLHTRYSTQGNKHNNGNNHPVLGHGYIVTHNGVIHGDDDYVFDMTQSSLSQPYNPMDSIYCEFLVYIVFPISNFVISLVLILSFDT